MYAWTLKKLNYGKILCAFVDTDQKKIATNNYLKNSDW